jgi:catechol 2,3-dioxygenase-like lactoylglutathione lyase family enzyme
MVEEVVPVLYVEDAARAVAWYGRLGFVKEWEHQFEPGFPSFGSVARGNVRLYLSEHKGDARPNTLIHPYVKDIDAVSGEFGIALDEERACRARVRARRPGRQPPARRYTALLTRTPAGHSRTLGPAKIETPAECSFGLTGQALCCRRMSGRAPFGLARLEGRF